MRQVETCRVCGVNPVPRGEVPICLECQYEEDRRAEAELKLEYKIDDLLPGLKEEDFKYLYDWGWRYYEDYGTLPSSQELLEAL